MRALVVREPGRYAVEELPEPDPGPGEVLVAVAAAGICGSDLEVVDGRRPAAYVRYPVVPGHEWAGRVVRAGPGVDGLAPGDPVVAEGLRFCGGCARCAEGRTNLCVAAYAETGFTHQGALADRLVVPARLVHRLPPARPLEPAALLEPAACVANGLLEAGVPRPGSRLAVVGDGPLGLLAVLLLRRGGGAILLGISGAQRQTIDPDTLTLNQLRVHGSFAASRAAWRWVVELYAGGILDPAPLVTHRFGLDEAPQALAALAAPDADAVKVLVRPDPDG
jgi:threonine dehydrogenase-like Zn-dependent dehydrogenase